MDVNAILMRVQRQVEQRWLSSLGRDVRDIEHFNIPPGHLFRSRQPFEVHLVNDNIGECVICQENFTHGQEYIVLPCNPTHPHKFHKDCIEPWLLNNDTCPTCRGSIEYI